MLEFFTPLPAFVTTFVSLMDYWVVVVTVVTLVYLVSRYPWFEKREVATTYILFMALFVFWAFRNLGNVLYKGSLPYYFIVISFVLDVGVVVYTAYLFYHYWNDKSLKGVIERLDLTVKTEEEVSEETYEEELKPEYEEMDSGYTYLVLESGREYGFRLFRRAVTKVPGMCFSRSHPDKIRKRHELEETPIFWFTERENIEDIDTIEPFRLNYLQEVLIDFVDSKKDDKGCVVLLDGLEYLIYKNPFEKVMDFIEDLVDNLSDKEGVTFIIALDEDSLDDKKLAFIREEFDEVRRMKEEGNVEKKRF
ncbi:MAG: DUF835 domain-containing protein [Candidatus Nanohaloarchaeota archaeon QJJ-9]|nr:DUF835 domain-containing protein [Candidatus Nanohaloarchaeota archaeon QJJ-9]